MQPKQSHYAQTGIFIAAFLVGVFGGSWILFGTTSGAAETTDSAATPSQSEVEKLKLQNQLLQAELENQKLQQQLAAASQQPATTERSTKTRRTRVTTSAGERTLAFWNTMNSIIDQEAQLRATPAGGVNGGNANSFIEARIAAGKFAVNALNKMNAQSVDSQVIQLARQLNKWYSDGVAICQQGQRVLGSDAASRQGQAGLSWKAKELAHATAVNSINKTGAKVRSAMIRQYGLEFPPLK